jgi:hypothetical protein
MSKYCVVVLPGLNTFAFNLLVPSYFSEENLEIAAKFLSVNFTQGTLKTFKFINFILLT